MSTKVSTDLIDLSSNTGGLVWAKGTTAEQPASATAGEMRVDTTTATTLVYNGTQWKTLKETAFVAPPVPTHFLVVAGGGAGSDYVGGGGGAGGLRTSYGSTSGGGKTPAESTINISLNTTYAITVGEGGVGGTVRRAQSLNGGNSTFSTITSIGGGGSGIGGGDAGSVALVGGSGGGGGSSTAAGAGLGAGAAGTVNEGYAGGSSGFASSDYPSAGGGGASAVGQSITSGGSAGGNGGTGLEVNIIGGTGNFYAGGGGGSSMAGGGSGGSGVGGTGATVTSVGGTSLGGTSGVINTGGGAGGGSSVVTGAPSGSIGVSGGSGVVILRYPTADLPYFTTTGTINTPSATDTVADAAYPVTNTAYYKLDNNANDSAQSGYIGQGGIFNGGSSKITIPSISPKSISMWVNVNSTSGIDALMGHDSITSNFIYWNTGDLRVGSTIFTNLDKVANQWVHIALVESGSNIICYNNGTPIQTLSGSLGTYNLIGGRTAGTDQYTTGKIDQVRIYNTALSSSNVALLYAETSATSSTLNYPAGVGGIALYEFSGNADSTSSSAYNGTATDVLYAFNGTATDVTYGNGRFNEAANFNGSSSYVTLSDSITTQMGNNNFSFSFWVYFNTLTQYDTPIAFQKNYRYLVDTATAGVVSFYDGTSLSTPSSTIATGNWYNIVVTKSSTAGRKIYVNGSVAASDSSNTNAINEASSSGKNLIGAYNSSGTYYYHLDGSIDQVRIFSSALAAGDVEDLYNEHFPTKFTDGSDTALMFTGGTGDITFLDTDPNVAVDYLVVAGGGGGGGAGGAGAGGLLTTYATTPSTSSGNQSQLTLNTSDTYTIIVGTGGAGSGTAYAPIGTVGVNSSISGSFTGSPITAAGGGAGGASSGSNGGDGGSGGGAGWSTSGGTATPSGQGFDGGSGIAAPNYSGGGGGGASETPITPTQSVAGAGGEGVTVSITGSAVGYAGGGGAAGYATAIGSGAAPAVGGGGAGRNWGGSTGNAPTPNPGTDGKGGGGGSGGDGGDGVVILRYTNTKTIEVGAGLTATTAEDGTDSVTTFTAGTGTITFS